MASTLRWASARGLHTEISPSGVFAKVTGDATALRSAFAAQRAHSASSELTVPSALRDDVRAAVFVDDLPTFTPQAATDPAVDQSATMRTGTPAGCTAGRDAERYPGVLGWTPNQYLTAYGHTVLHRRGLTGKGQRVALVEIDGFEPGDIPAFARCFGYAVPPIRTIPVAMKQPFPPGLETTLDLQILSAAAPGLKAIDVYESEDPVLAMSAALGDPAKRPDVISISLAGCENNAASFLSNVRMLDTLFMLAAGAGTSVLVATGDLGSTSCLSSSAEAHAPLGVLSPSYPATSPYVTAVGGTNIELDRANRVADEWVWNNSPQDPAAGTGGQSLLFGAPWWQKTALDTPNRTVPDIAALADNRPGYAYFCTSPGCAQINPVLGWMSVGGTSAATPLVAAGVALGNQAAARRGQPTLGFLNPLIYAVANTNAGRRVISDVTVGTNDTGTAIPPPLSNGQPIGAYKATRGYDMATGWGSLRLARFSDAALRYGRGAAVP